MMSQTLFRQPLADGGADSAGAAGDQRQGALILVFHSQNPRFFWMIGLSTRPADWRWETGPPRAIPGGKTSFHNGYSLPLKRYRSR